VNARQWRAAAKPIVWDLAAVLEELGTMRFDPADVPSNLYDSFWRAVLLRDEAALRLVCGEMKREAQRRMLREAA